MSPVYPTTPQSDATAPDLHYFVSGLRRRSGVMLMVSAAIVTMTIAFLILAPRQFTSVSAVMLDTRKHQVVDTEQVLTGLTADTNTTETEVEVIRSRSLASKVSTDLNLRNDPEFNPNLGSPSLGSTLKGLLVPGGARKALSDAEIERHIEDRLLANLKVSRVGTSYVIRLAYSSTSPRTAAAVANRFAERYVIAQLDTKVDATSQANTWLNDQLNQLRDQLGTAERAVEQYRAANGLLSAVGTPLTEQEISNLNRELASARAEYADRAARVNSAKRGSNERLGEALNSDVVKTLRGQQASTERRLAELNARYGPRHPLVVQAQGEESKVQAQIDDEVRRIVGNLYTERDVAAERVASIQRSLNGARGTLVSNNSASVKLRELERNAESVRTLYESFLTRAKSTGADRTLQTPDSRVIARAAPSERASFPNVPITMALGLILAAFSAFAIGLLAEFLDDGLRTSEAVEQLLGAAVIAGIPIAPGNGKAASVVKSVIDKPMSAFAESFRNIRAHIASAPDTSSAQVVMITSALPGEGKSTTALALARILAQAGDSVILIDCDLRRRALAKNAKLKVVAGLAEVLMGKVRLEECLVRDAASNLVMVPLSDAKDVPPHLIGSPSMDALLEKLRGSYRYIVLDCPPVLPLADARLLAPKVDLTLMLVQWRKTPKKSSIGGNRNTALGWCPPNCRGAHSD